MTGSSLEEEVRARARAREEPDAARAQGGSDGLEPQSLARRLGEVFELETLKVQLLLHNTSLTRIDSGIACSREIKVLSDGFGRCNFRWASCASSARSGSRAARRCSSRCASAARGA